MKLTLIVLKDDDDDKYWCQCLEYDIGAQGDDIHTAINNFNKMLACEIAYSESKCVAPFSGINQAPKYYQNMARTTQ